MVQIANKILPKVNMNKVHAEKCRRSFFYFVQYFWDVIIAEDPVWNWHIKYICDELQEIGLRVKAREEKLFDYYIFNVPPGSSKSTIATIMYPLWVWTIDPTQRFICGSYASTPAEDLADKAFTIYNSDKFKYCFPELHEKRTRNSGGKTHFKNGLKGERYTTSTGSGITGIHAHQLIVDDPMNPKIAASASERLGANTWVSETLSSRKVNKKVSVTIVIMQRLHENDTTGYLMGKEKEGLRVKRVCLPAEVNDSNKIDVQPAFLLDNYVEGLLDPVRLPKLTLGQEKITLGSYGYAGQMLQRPALPEGGILKKNWFYIVKRSGVPFNVDVHFQVDTAYTESTANDPTGIIAYYKENFNIVLLNAQSVYKEFTDLIAWLPEFAKANGYTPRSKIYVEPKASGKSVVQTLKKLTGLNIIECEAPTDDKLSRVTNCSPTIEAGRIWMHEGSFNEGYITQVTTFPFAMHDEYVDCTTAIIKRELLAPVVPKNIASLFK